MGNEGAKYSMRPRTEQKGLEQFPGPGQYEPMRTLIDLRSPTAKINSSRNETVIADTPGPGTYDPNSSLIRKSSPQYRIDGSEKRLRDPSGDAVANPGPGHY